MNNDKIDFVITWVDGNDSAWQKERNRFANYKQIEIDKTPCRFRDMGTLRYWFRGVEKFAPWVNNIFFVTWGHLPEWLNVNHPKLKIIKHSDYIPSEFLPTFNSNVIEFFFHKIDGLSEQFVYFNDDMFLIDKVTPQRFFKNGLPCDLGAMRSIINRGMFGTAIYLANMLINDQFNKRESIKKDFFKWYNLNTISTLFRNIIYYFVAGKWFAGFVDYHLPQGYLKKSYEEVWKECEKDIIRTSNNKFRQYGDVSFWLIRYWQLASGTFTPYNVDKDGFLYNIGEHNISSISNCIRRQSLKMVCLNDNEKTEPFDKYKQIICDAFEAILPEKSLFEK